MNQYTFSYDGDDYILTGFPDEYVINSVSRKPLGSKQRAILISYLRSENIEISDSATVHVAISKVKQFLDGNLLPCSSKAVSAEFFIASSINEFRSERLQIPGVLHNINREFTTYLAEQKVDGDNQNEINKHIASAFYFVGIIGQKIGIKTMEEFNIALKLHSEFGKPKIKFFMQDFAGTDIVVSQDVIEFGRKLYNDAEFYPQAFKDSRDLINQIELFFHRVGATNDN